MKAYPIFALIFILSFIYSGCFLSNYTQNPEAAPFITTDIDNFWTAFERYQNNPEQNPFQEHYLDIGTKGLQDFIPNRIKSADALYQRVQQQEERYLKVKDLTLRMKEKEEECRQAFQQLKEWYPEAQFPPVYFVIGRFTSGGTQSWNGLLIGAEMQSELENVPHIVAHELIHFQQKSTGFFSKLTLLEACIREGSADFIGELISGNHINQKAFAYGKAHQAALYQEFLTSMQQTEYIDWLYQTSKKDDRPNDLGYWIGYEITKAFYDKAANKKAAVDAILNISDAEDLLEKSGFLEDIKRVQANEVKTVSIPKFQLKTLGVNIRVTDMDKAIDFYQNTIGFKIKSRKKHPNIVELENNGLQLWLKKVSKQRKTLYGEESQTILTLQTNNLDSVMAVYQTKGVKFVREVRENGVGHSAPFRDPFGNIISLLEQDKFPVPRFVEPKIYNLGLYLPDIEIAKAFYLDILGFEVRTLDYLPAVLPLNHIDQSLAIILHNKPIQPVELPSLEVTQTNILLKTDNLKAFKTFLMQQNVEIIENAENAGFAFKDVFGNILEVI